MKLLIATGTRYFRSTCGDIWTETSYDRDMWREYQAGFDEVGIFTRVLHRDPVNGIARPAGGPGITYFGIPEWNTREVLLRIPRVMRVARQAVLESDAVWLHSPGLEANFVYFWAHRLKKLVSLECRGDQALSRVYWDQRGARSGYLLSRYFTLQFQRHLSQAWGCIFVAGQLKSQYQRFLKQGARAEVISDARIPASSFKPPQGHAGGAGGVFRLVNIGRLDAQKDQATLIQACALLERSGFTRWELHLAGDGPLRPDLTRLAAALHIAQKVKFHGFVPWGEPLFRFLGEMDLFVLSSINEGMPRALLEAMARGLPCISTAVSGADELLSPEALVPCGRVDLLASRIRETIQSPGALERNAAQCWLSVQAYRIPQLLERKEKYLLDFREYVRKYGG